MNKNIIEELILISKKAYAPYSNLLVSSIFITENNKSFFGANIENCSYSATICAERVALTSMLMNTKNDSIKIIYLYTSNNDFIYPCGVCLQFIQEFSNKNIDIIIYNNKKAKIKTTLYDLMPYNQKIKFK